MPQRLRQVRRSPLHGRNGTLIAIHRDPPLTPSRGASAHVRQRMVTLAAVMHKPFVLDDALLLETHTLQLSPPTAQVPAWAAGRFCHP